MDTISAKKYMNSFHEALEFCKVGVWQIRSDRLPRFRQFWLTQLRIIILSLRGFAEDNCQLRASALTFYSLLSIVPIAAMAFGIAKGFGFEKVLEKEIYSRFAGQEEVVQRVIIFAQSMLENTKGGVIAGIGITVLLWSVLKVFSNIESSFNHIWGIKNGRTLMRKFSDYISAMLICPFLFIMSSSATVLVRTKVEGLTLQLVGNETISALIHTLLNYLPFCVTWLLFCFLYVFLPNTKVSFRAALFAGVIAGTLFQFLQWVYIESQVGLAQYGAIYGSFAALPLFLVWLQLSWLIVLLGAEISYAEQNVDTFELEPESRNLSQTFQNTLCTALARTCVLAFEAKQEAPSAAMLSSSYGIPSALTELMLQRLVDARILRRVTVAEDAPVGYQPATPTDKLKVLDVLNALDGIGSPEIPVEQGLMEFIATKTSEIQSAAMNSPANVLLREVD